jgi:hypothetical protein
MNRLIRHLLFIIAATLTFCLFYVAGQAMGQVGPPVAVQPAPTGAQSTYQPTEVQHLKLEVAQAHAQLAQRDYMAAQKAYQDSMQALQAASDQVKKENGWPETTIFNYDQLTYSAPPPPPPTSEPAKGKGK